MPEHFEAKLRDVLIEKGLALFSGRIDVATGAGGGALGGVLHMSEGQVLEARLGTSSGEPALWRMLLADKTRIATEPGKPRATGGAVLGKPDALLARFDERVLTLERVAEKVGGFDRVWAIRFDALAAVLDELPDAINPILRLLDGKRTVRHVVAECGLDDMLALRILGKLLARGILVLPDNVLELAQDARKPSTDAIDVTDEGLEAALAASLAEIDAEDAAQDAAQDAQDAQHAAQGSAQGSVGRVDQPIPLVTQSRTQRTEPPTEPHAPPAASAKPSYAVPSIAALPSAPRVETNDDLRSWLGPEEAFFGAEIRARLPSGDVPVARGHGPTGIGVVPMIMLFLLAVGIGIVIASLLS